MLQETVWHTIEFILNTVLFALAGTIIGNEAVHHGHDNWFLTKTVSSPSSPGVLIPSADRMLQGFNKFMTETIGCNGLLNTTTGTPFPNANAPCKSFWSRTDALSIYSKMNALAEFIKGAASTIPSLTSCNLHYTRAETLEHVGTHLAYFKKLTTFEGFSIDLLGTNKVDPAAAKLQEVFDAPACADVHSQQCHDLFLNMARTKNVDGPYNSFAFPAPWFFEDSFATTKTMMPNAFEQCEIKTEDTYYNELIPNILGWEDVGWLFVMYAFAILIRGVMIGVLYFPLKWSGKYGVNRANATFMWWGGLRGAVGLALAMTYYQRVTALDIVGKPKDAIRIMQAVQILFHVGFIALLTLVVQAPSSPWLMRKLGIIKTDEAQKEIHRNMMTRLDDFVRIVLNVRCVCVCVYTRGGDHSGEAVGLLRIKRSRCTCLPPVPFFVSVPSLPPRRVLPQSPTSLSTLHDRRQINWRTPSQTRTSASSSASAPATLCSNTKTERKSGSVAVFFGGSYLRVTRWLSV